jgi:hypothetical protein
LQSCRDEITFEGFLHIEKFSIYNDAIESKEIIKLLTDY